MLQRLWKKYVIPRHIETMNEHNNRNLIMHMFWYLMNGQALFHISLWCFEAYLPYSAQVCAAQWSERCLTTESYNGFALLLEGKRWGQWPKSKEVRCLCNLHWKPQMLHWRAVEGQPQVMNEEKERLKTSCLSNSCQEANRSCNARTVEEIGGSRAHRNEDWAWHKIQSCTCIDISWFHELFAICPYAVWFHVWLMPGNIRPVWKPNCNISNIILSKLHTRIYTHRL